MANVETKDQNKEVKKHMVKALFSYTPVNSDELQLKVNDILEVIEETEEGWWQGILNDSVGMFPSNFVVELDSLPEESNNVRPSEQLSPVKIAVKSKNTSQNEPLNRHVHNSSAQLKHGIANSSLDDTDGLCVSKSPPEPLPEKKTSMLGKKPSFDNSAPRLPPKPVREQAKVIFPYEASNEDELSLKEGDVILVISKEVEDKGWWKGELNNKVGVFPDNFVKLIKSEEQKKPERPEKPSSVGSAKVSLKRVNSDRKNAECSPKLEKKITKTPPAKPPPPEIFKKELDRPVPPCPTKKPQLPNPVKKPSRASVGVKVPVLPMPIPLKPSENSSPIITNSLNLTLGKSEETKTNDKPLNKPDKNPEKIQKSEDCIKKKEEEFDAIETSGKKLIHLTANRAKAPTRRPPSCIFLKEAAPEGDSKDATDSRRLSEPLLDFIPPSVNILSKNDSKPKSPPMRPIMPLVKSNNIIKSDGSFVNKVVKYYYMSHNTI